jgi:integrase
MQIVQSSPDIKPAKRRDVHSALKVLADCIGKPPEQISAAPKTLQREMAAVNYHFASLSKSRWTNIKSLCRKGLRTAGVNIMPGRRANSKFSQAWMELRRQCGPSHQMGLSRFMNYCSEKAIEPKDVDAAVFDQFELELTTNSLELDSHKIYAQTRRIWDKAADAISDWPTFRTGVATKPRSHTRPWSAYPEAYVKDVEAFLMRGSRDYRHMDLDDNTPMLRPATIKSRRITLRLLSDALAESGTPVAQFVGLRTLVEGDATKKILEHFMIRNGGLSTPSIYGYATLLRVIAEHYVKVDSETLRKIQGRRKKTFVKQHGMTTKNRERLRQFENPANVYAIYALPQKLLKLARAAEKDSEQAFCLASYAVAIEIELHAPLRIENLHSLSLSKNVIMPTDLRDGEVILSISGKAVKNKQDLEHALSPAFAKMLREYLADFRFGATAQSDWLFPNAEGKQRHKDAFAQQIKAIVKRHTGITCNVHLFRGLLVKMCLDMNPHDLETPSKILGHTSTRTTARAYSEGKNTAGQRAFSEFIDAKLREPEYQFGHRRSK